ncbi:MAG TPA: pitrilysin family protein [Nostocaceae cyanobacterium]|nr:pitrilysin family protein [Nostocaceae cyanobacterium]
MFPASIFRLDNGLTLIHQYISTTPVVVTDVWVRAGAIFEPEEWLGMAHFLEHMIFKGTNNLRPGDFDYNIEKLGGVSNAATSYDYAHYSLSTAAPYLADTLPYLGELLLNAAIPDNEFIRERDVVLEELRSCQDNPDWWGFQSLIQTVYQNHPYGRCILGSEQQLMQHTPEAMRCFHRTHYQPENMSVVMVGCIDADVARELVDTAFAEFPQRDSCPLVKIEKIPTINGIHRQELKLPRIEQARLTMAWIAPGAEQLRIAHGFDLLSVLLAEGRTSRLVRDLREERQLVQGICAHVSLQRDASLFTITAWLEPEDVEQVETLICNHLHNLQNIGINEQELTRIRRLVCNEYAFATETPHQLSGLYGYYNTISKAEFAANYLQQILSFEADELQKLVKSYLSPDNYAVTILKPC